MNEIASVILGATLWAVAVALALFGTAIVSGVSWDSAVPFAPYLLILACPVMHLLMRPSHKRDAGHSDASTK